MLLLRGREGDLGEVRTSPRFHQDLPVHSQKVTEDEDEAGAGGEEVEEESKYKEASFSLVKG